MRRFGIAGLFLFVLVPFWMTGPLVGAIIGFLIGLHPVVNLLVVLSATGLAIFLYALFLEPLNAWASAVHPYAVFAVIVTLAVLAWLARRWWLRREAPARARRSDVTRSTGPGRRKRAPACAGPAFKGTRPGAARPAGAARPGTRCGAHVR